MILFSSSSALLWNTFLARSDEVASAASAFSLASFRSFSRPMILFSSSSALLWNTFLARSESSAAVPALSSLATAATIFSSVFSRSSSRPETRLVRAFISSSVAASCFSFSSSCKVAMEQALGGDVQLRLQLPGLELQLSHLVLALLGADPGRLHLLLGHVRLVAGVVLLNLHRLHLLLDCPHLEEL